MINQVILVGRTTKTSNLGKRKVERIMFNLR